MVLWLMLPGLVKGCWKRSDLPLHPLNQEQGFLAFPFTGLSFC